MKHVILACALLFLKTGCSDYEDKNERNSLETGAVESNLSKSPTTPETFCVTDKLVYSCTDEGRRDWLYPKVPLPNLPASEMTVLAYLNDCNRACGGSPDDSCSLEDFPAGLNENMPWNYGCGFCEGVGIGHIPVECEEH